MTSGTTLLAVLSLGILAAVQTDGPAPQERSARAPQTRPAWQWTAEERIAMRTDSVAARDRVARERSRVVSNAPDPNAAVIVDSFDGRTHPELFLPHEVMRHLISIAFRSSPRTEAAFRGAMQDDLVRLGLPADFWQRFEASSIGYIGDATRYDTLSLSQAPEEDVAVARREACRSGAAALAAARREFGEERFDRFLYEAVASGMFHVTDQLPDPQRMRDQARGCR